MSYMADMASENLAFGDFGASSFTDAFTESSFAAPAVMPTMGASSIDWLGTMGGVTDIYCRVTGTCKDQAPAQSGQPVATGPALPPWLWIAGGIAALGLLFYLVKD